MKLKKRNPTTRFELHRETLRDLTSLQQVAAGATRPGGSCYPVVCFTTTVASSCC
jgi:hypothetical protein